MSKNLIVVESPAKAKTMSKYLGKDFTCLASYGHVRDLMPKQGAVDTDNDFAMKYQLIEKNEKHVEAIVKAMKQAESLYLATDPDREGEAISWHLYEILKERDVIAGKPVHRVEFHEITKTAIQHAIQQPRSCRSTLLMRNRRAARSTIWSASICRRCCGKRCAAACRPGGCRARRCGSSPSARKRSSVSCRASTGPSRPTSWPKVGNSAPN